MEPCRYRLFVCTNSKPGGKASCTLHGSQETIAALKEELKKKGLQFDTKVVSSGCLDLCERGPNLIVYPEGIWYSGVNRECVAEFVQTQLVDGKRYEKKACNEEELKSFFEKRKARKTAELKK